MTIRSPALRPPGRTRLARYAAAVAAVVLIGAAGCGGGTDNDLTGPNGRVPLQSTGAFRITISSGTRPTFTWPGAGGAIAVSLSPYDPTYDSTNDPDMWDLYPDFLANSPRSVTSPVTYGTRQPGTAYFIQPNPRTLVAGRRYVVVVVRDDNRNASQEFIP